MDIAGAEKKIRQAEFFLWHLENASKEYRHEVGNTEPMEFYFSACLSAAQSVYYVLDETGGMEFTERQRRWRGALPEPQRSGFGRMIGLRDKDVHFAVTRAKPLPKFVAEDLRDKHGFYTRSVLFGPQTLTEAENVDGTKVSGYFGLRGTVGLYIEQEGRKIEATTAAREFIEQLRSLVEAMKTSPTNP